MSYKLDHRYGVASVLSGTQHGPTAFGCFLIGLITGIEVGLVMADAATKSKGTGDTKIRVLEAIFLALNIGGDDYGNLPKRRECRILP